MHTMMRTTRSQLRLGRVTLLIAASLIWVNSAAGQGGTLAEPFPAPATNAALHYQRALLHLAQMKTADSEFLEQPIWQVVDQVGDQESFSQELLNTLYQGRRAIQSGITGARMDHCNFGIDFSQRGASTEMPHVEPMVRLGRLMTLRGAYAEVKGEWDEAAVIYVDGIRMGRHLTHQSTLLEVMAGTEILRNNYFALAHWAAQCPSRQLVARAFGALETLSTSLVNPAQAITREAGILRSEFQQLKAAYPNGPWAEMILESMGLDVPDDSDAAREAAIAACVSRKIPKKVFDDPKTFRSFVTRVEKESGRFTEAMAAAMTLPLEARITRGKALFDKYQQILVMLSGDVVLNPAEVGAYFGLHEAELAVTRVALAVSASKSDQFPASLDDVAARFGGNVPVNPYDGSAIQYSRHDDGKGFRLLIPATEVAGVGLAKVNFDTQLPAAVEP